MRTKAEISHDLEVLRQKIREAQVKERPAEGDWVQMRSEPYDVLVWAPKELLDQCRPLYKESFDEMFAEYDRQNGSPIEFAEPGIDNAANSAAAKIKEK